MIRSSENSHHLILSDHNRDKYQNKGQQLVQKQIIHEKAMALWVWLGYESTHNLMAQQSSRQTPSRRCYIPYNKVCVPAKQQLSIRANEDGFTTHAFKFSSENWKNKHLTFMNLQQYPTSSFIAMILSWSLEIRLDNHRRTRQEIRTTIWCFFRESFSALFKRH